MTLGECIKEYRELHRLSQRQFSDMCGLSNAYISMLEKNVNSKTGETMVPTYGVYKKVANVMGITVDELMEKANESFVSLGSNMTLRAPAMEFSPDLMKAMDRVIHDKTNGRENELMSLFNTMTNTDKEKLLDYARYIVESYKRPDKRRK